MQAHRITVSAEEVARRICAQPACGFVLGPQNRSGYCAHHSKPSDRAQRRFCAEPGCGKRLRSDNTLEFCFAHRCQKLRSVANACRECGKRLNAQNKSGYCSNHFHLSRPSHVRAIARASAQPKCAEPACQKPANKNGYCGAHRFPKNRPSVKAQFCKGPDCGALLRSNNDSGFCRKHFYLAHPVERKRCQERGCQAVLGNNNKSGYCPIHWMQHYGREHRDSQRMRTAEWRARQRAKLAMAERKAIKRKPGRKREDEVRKRVRELRPRLSWGELKAIVDQETGQRRSISAYRYLARI